MKRKENEMNHETWNEEGFCDTYLDYLWREIGVWSRKQLLTDKFNYSHYLFGG